MQSVESQFRDKVFDEDVLNFCLVLIEFLEKMPAQSPWLRRVVLDALTVNSSLKEVSVFVRSLNTLPLAEFTPHMEAFLDSCGKLSQQKMDLSEFLMTVRHLAECAGFREWGEFFAGVAIAGDKAEFLEGFLMTVRHLAENPEFKNWAEYFKATRIADLGTELGADFSMTSRHLAERRDYTNWNEFFEAIATLGDRRELSADLMMTLRHLAGTPLFIRWEDFYAAFRMVCANNPLLADMLMTVRHLTSAKNFAEWETFFRAMRIVSGKTVDNMSDFLMAVRHAINYFSGPDSLKNIFLTIANYPQYSEACAFGQLDSKQWLIEEARRVWGDDWGRVFVLAGWIGFLPRFIFDAGIKTTGVRSFDIDTECGPAAESLNQAQVQKDWIFKSSTQDITEMRYPTNFTVRRKDGSVVEMFESPEVVINTSCEHIADIGSWWDQIPKGMRVIVQSNDAFHITEHVRCFKTLAEFETAMGMSQVDYRGEKRLADFNRFMLIGRR